MRTQTNGCRGGGLPQNLISSKAVLSGGDCGGVGTPLEPPRAQRQGGGQQLILLQELTRVRAARGLTPDMYCSAVSTGRKQMVASLNFAGHGPDSRTAGCQPFLVTYSGTDDHFRSMDLAMVAI